MKNSFNLLTVMILIISIFAISSCKKKDSTTPSTSSSVPKLSMEVYHPSSGTNDTTKYIYDSSGRISKVTTSSDTSYFTVVYTSSTVTMSNYNKINVLKEKDVYTLNSGGLATSLAITQYSKSAKNILTKNKNNKGINNTTSSATYTYDSNGYLIKEIDISGTDTTTDNYTITSGNQTSETEKDVQSGTTTNYSITNSYFSNTNTISYANFGVAFLGKDNTNLIKTSVESIVGSSTTYTTTYSYVYDSSNRVTKETATTPGSTDYSTYTYTN